jgi:hypothetical protein
MELLREPETCQRFHRAVEQNFAHLLPLLQPPPATDRQSAQTQVDTARSVVISVLREAATDTLGYRTVVPGVTKPWVTRHVADVCAQRRLAFARHKLDPSPLNLDRFKAVEKLARISCRAAQRRQKRQQEASAQDHWLTAPGSRVAWKKIRNLADPCRHAPTHSAAVVQPDTGALCTTAVEKASAFASHHRKLFTPPDVCSPHETDQRAQSASTVCRLRVTHAADAPAMEAPFCLEDVHVALSRMANHKAPGTDGLPTELLKYSDPSGLQILLLLFN